MQIVSLDLIPPLPYSCPTDNIAKMYVVGQDMERICKQNKGMGLAASQVGLPWNFFVYWANYPDKIMKFEYMVDCTYSSSSDSKEISIEGCLSLPRKNFRVKRFNEIVVTGSRIVTGDAFELNHFTESFSGIKAVILQHEIDHAFGRERMIDVIGERVQFGGIFS